MNAVFTALTPVAGIIAAEVDLGSVSVEHDMSRSVSRRVHHGQLERSNGDRRTISKLRIRCM